MKSSVLLFVLSVAIFSILGFVLFPFNPQVMAVVVILGLASAGAWLIKQTGNSKNSSFEMGVLLFAFTIRLWLGYALYGFGLSQVLGDEDASGWSAGWAYATRWNLLGIETIFGDMFNVFAGPVKNIGQSVVWGSVLYAIGEPSRLAVSAVNCFLGAMTAVVIYRLAQRLFDERSARLAAVFVLAWPSLVLMSASTSKEPLVIFLEWFSLYVALRAHDHPTIGRFSILFVSLLVLYTMRSYAAYVCAVAILVGFFVSRSKHRFRSILLAIALGLIGTVLFAQLGIVQQDVGFASDRLPTIADWRVNVAASTGSGISVYDTSSMIGSISTIPLGVAYFFFAPFPWEFGSGSLRNQILVLEVLLFCAILLGGFWSGFKTTMREKWVEILPLFVFAILYASIQLIGLSNVGLAWRHRQTIIPLFLILSAVGFAKSKRRAASRYSARGSVPVARLQDESIS